MFGLKQRLARAWRAATHHCLRRLATHYVQQLPADGAMLVDLGDRAMGRGDVVYLTQQLPAGWVVIPFEHTHSDDVVQLVLGNNVAAVWDLVGRVARRLPVPPAQLAAHLRYVQQSLEAQFGVLLPTSDEVVLNARWVDSLP